MRPHEYQRLVDAGLLVENREPSQTARQINLGWCQCLDLDGVYLCANPTTQEDGVCDFCRPAPDNVSDTDICSAGWWVLQHPDSDRAKLWLVRIVKQELAGPATLEALGMRKVSP